MFVKSVPKKTIGSLFCFVCLMALLSPTSAQAGFGWTPAPETVAPQQPATPTPDNTAPANVSGPLTPEPDSQLPVPVGNVESAPVEQPKPTPEPLVVDNNPMSAPIDEKPPVETAKPAPVVPILAPNTPVVGDDVVEGFGKDIPLAMALHDIVPAKYAYAFSPSDIAGSKISWRGGKPWLDVLKDALAPYNFDVTVTDNQIIIFTKQAPIAPAPAPSAPKPQPVSSADPLPLTEAETTPAAPAPTMVARLPAEVIAANAESTYKSAINLEQKQRWEARLGTTLRQTIESWSKTAQVELNWSTPYDYPINSAFYFDGSFAEAVNSILSSYGKENTPPKARLYPNLPEGPSVLMVN
jgi:Toxin co-regulated pilus biosynthesis protein Q